MIRPTPATTVLAVLGIILATTGVACGGTAASSTAAQTGPVTVPKTPVTVNVLSGGTPQENQQELDSIKLFERKFPTIKVHVQFVPYSQEAATTRAAIAGKTSINIIGVFPGAYGGSFKSGLLPLDNYITPVEHREWPLLKSSVSPDGHIYSIANTSYAYAFAYNKKLFRKVGVSPPTSWGGFLNVCDKFSAAGITPIAAGWKDGYYAEGFFYQFADMLLTRPQAAQFAQQKLPITSAPFEKSLNLLLEMNRHDCFGSGAEGRDYYDDLRDQFAAGDAAIVLEPTGGGPVEQGGQYPKALGADNIGVFPPPPVPGSHYKHFVDYGPNSGLAITNWSSKSQQDAAWIYIRWTMSPEAQEYDWKTIHSFPAVNTVHFTTNYQPTEDVFRWIKWPQDYTIYTSWPQSAEAVFDQQASSLMTGRISPSALLGQIQQAINLEKQQLTQ
jgi:ABC-type glycerol-3-phosphate transport system substrate-binding protein